MMTLYQREQCPFCAKVRRALTDLNVEYRIVNVPKLGSERSELLSVEGVDSPEVPVLVDGDRVIRDSDEIVAYLQERSDNFYRDPAYGLTRRLPGVGFSDAVGAAREELAKEGFGILTEIDVKATLKKKIGADFRNYVILGACNPPFAHQALLAEPGVGLLMPCNVVVTEENDGTSVVSAIDPSSLFGLVNRPEVAPLAKEVGDRLKRVMAALPTAD